MRFRTCVAILSILVLAPVVALPLAGQTVNPVTQIISISPISLVFGAIGAEYEHSLGPTQSIGVSGTYYRPQFFYYLSGEAKYRYYPQEKALEGLGIGITAGVTQIGEHGDGKNDSGAAASIGFAVDYQWLLGPKKHFAITLGTGARRLISIGKAVDGASFTLPTARISIGRAF